MLFLYLPYISYVNIAWASINVAKSKKINNLQKHAIRLMNNKNIFSHSRYLLRLDKILKVYQLTKLNFTTFMHKI